MIIRELLSTYLCFTEAVEAVTLAAMKLTGPAEPLHQNEKLQWGSKVDCGSLAYTLVH